ncbi:predicted protein [Nematostella vectensis]|uniref:Sodium/calcium exchanger membrane region domain-containing protein n=1 Tax=Nematostella vectensis TaxID=45351 RepID=A7SMH8_NEMVE|nr:predicted protein [Nematostella vectensis]|eukprot:XP_001627159.1 predicted protein [Nematostella vectensis]
MAFSVKALYVVLFVLLAFQTLCPSESHPLFRRSVGEAKNGSGENNKSEKVAPCLEERNGIYPCSSTITGNFLLMVFYGAILGVAAKCISDGAELLLDLGLPASIVGGMVLPLLGAVPDSAIIIVSGLGADAQDKLNVGMGTLAGSTIMLLTAAWAGSVLIGRCDLNRHGEAIEKTGYGKLSCTKQGVTVLPDVVTAVYIMLGTSISYFIVQIADWKFGATRFGPQPAYIGKAALAMMIVCFIAFIAYLAFLMYDSKAAERRADRHRQERIQRRVLHHFVLMANKRVPEKIGGDDIDSAEDQKAQEAHVQKKYFKAWHLGSGMKTKEASERDPILGETTDEKAPLRKASFEMSEEAEEHEEEEKEESKAMLTFKSVGLLVLGVGLVTIFADPMCDVLSSLTDTRNHSYIPISSSSKGILLGFIFESSIRDIFVTSHSIVQIADWKFGATRFGPQPAYIGKAALAMMIVCFIAFIAYLAFLMYDSKAAERRADRHRQERIQRRVLHHFVLMANKRVPEKIGGDDIDSAEDQKAQEAHVQKKYFKAWHLGSGMKTKEASERDPILGETTDEKAPLRKASFEMSEEAEEHEEEEKEESKAMLTFKSVGLLVLGVGLVTIFADPMCDVLSSLTDTRNHSYIPISSFYVSFVVTPLCSNASELLSSLIFASKKKKENVSMTFSQLYGAGTMNNTLCLGIFAALVYFRELRWYFSAEVTVIVLIQWAVGLVGLRHTYKIWMAGLIGTLYIFSIALIALLESRAIGWKHVPSAFPELVDKLIILNAPHFSVFKKYLYSHFSQMKKSWNKKKPGMFTDEDIEAWKYTFGKPGSFTPPLNYYRNIFSSSSSRSDAPKTKISVPVMVVWGTADLALEKEMNDGLDQYVEDLTIRYIEGASHWVQQDEPELVNMYIQEFLDTNVFARGATMFAGEIALICVTIAGVLLLSAQLHCVKQRMLKTDKRQLKRRRRQTCEKDLNIKPSPRHYGRLVLDVESSSSGNGTLDSL